MDYCAGVGLCVLSCLNLILPNTVPLLALEADRSCPHHSMWPSKAAQLAFEHTLLSPTIPVLVPAVAGQFSHRGRCIKGLSPSDVVLEVQ